MSSDKDSVSISVVVPVFNEEATLGELIRRLTAVRRPMRLDVSDDGATDAERSRLVPPARRWPLAELMDACRDYTTTLRRRIFFEWTLIDGQNDGPAQAQALGRLLSDMDAHVNLIPLNPVAESPYQPSTDANAGVFQRILERNGIPATVRLRRGIDIDAGCGQLRRRVGAS